VCDAAHLLLVLVLVLVLVLRIIWCMSCSLVHATVQAHGMQQQRLVDCTTGFTD
jgi:hypothetical protein